MRYLFFLLPILFACSGNQKSNDTISESAIIFSNVNIVDVRNGEILENRFVVVDSNKIITIAEEAAQWPAEATIIDATNQYLTPGLAEMHAHIPSPPVSDQQIHDVLFLYAANGVTTIRGMLGHPRHLDLREQAKRQEIISPVIYTSSTSFNGNSVKTTEEGIEKVQESKDAGYDFLKFHPDIQADVHDAIIKKADEVGIPFAGHVSREVGIRHALKSEYASVDHIDGFVEGLVPASAGVDPYDNGFFGYNFNDLDDTSMIPELVQLTKDHQVWIVPTQTLLTRWFSPTPGEEMSRESEMKYMPASTIEQWITSKNRIISGDSYNPEQWERFINLREQLIFALNQEGHGLLLGSDAPQVFNVPGFSIHHEMQDMIDAGLTPAEVLRTGTIHVARYFDREGEMGEIITGADADLILSTENPLTDIKTLSHPVGVMVQGQWMERTEIDSVLDEIAERNKNQ